MKVIVKRGNKALQLREWATEAAMCAGAAVKSAWSNRFCLSGAAASESNWKSGGDLERAAVLRKRKLKWIRVMSALQSGEAWNVFWSAFKGNGGGGFTFIGTIFTVNVFSSVCSFILFSTWTLTPLMLPPHYLFHLCSCFEVIQVKWGINFSIAGLLFITLVHKHRPTFWQMISLTVLLESCNHLQTQLWQYLHQDIQ